MVSSGDKRTNVRCNHETRITFSYFNKAQRYEAQTINCSAGGLRFKSDVFLQPGASVYIRVKNNHCNGLCSGDCRGLGSVALAEVKWCREFLNGSEPFYEIGARYYEPDY
jgi:hypothetical protein